MWHVPPPVVGLLNHVPYTKRLPLAALLSALSYAGHSADVSKTTPKTCHKIEEKNKTNIKRFLIEKHKLNLTIIVVHHTGYKA